MLFQPYAPVEFSAPDGKIFTEIEITTEDENKPSGTGWSNGKWTGSAGHVHIDGVGQGALPFTATSIKFTLDDYDGPELLAKTVDDEQNHYASQVGGGGSKNIYYTSGETWTQTITSHPGDNSGWTYDANGVYAYGCIVLDWNTGQPVSSGAAINANAIYYFCPIQ